jgi:hypothetical protein
VKGGVTIIMSQDTTLAGQSSSVESGVMNINGPNVNIYGGTIDGYRNSLSQSQLTANDTGGGGGAGLEINEGASNVNVVGVTSENNTGDGFIAYGGNAQPPITNINFKNDVAVNNVRDGITIDNANYTLTDQCVLNGNGLSNNEPNFYAANGYRVEPDPGNTAEFNVVEHSQAENNFGQGIMLTGDVSTAIWPTDPATANNNSALDNTVAGNVQGGVWVSAGADTVSGNAVTTTNASNGIEVEGGSLTGSGNTINGQNYD